MTDNTQPLALMLADRLHHEQPTVLRIDAEHAGEELRRQHARIAELEAQLESIGAGVGSEPIAWLVCTEEGDPDMVFLSQHEAQQYLEDDERPTPLYTHPSPPEGMVGGWTKASQQLPPCRDDQLYIGINTAGFAGVFNVVRVIHGNTYCLMEVAEESVSIMSDLDIWQPFAPPTTSAGSGKGE